VCNLYSLNTPRAGTARFFRVSHNRAAAYEPLPAIFPGRVAPVVRQSVDGEREITLMSWGFVLLQNGKAPKRVTNVRDDKIRESKFWRGSFEERRCLVPASSFCEPNGDVKPATWHWFALRGMEERPLLAFPGIWRRYQGPVRKDGPHIDLEVYAFLTTTPNKLVATINHERARRSSRHWLSGSPQEAFELAREYPSERMCIVQEGFEKKDLLRAAA
jgi:putative SOS response-associated peptidase YedK